MSEDASGPAIQLGRLAAGLSATCADYLAQHRRGLEEAVRKGDRGTEVALRYAQMFDGLLGSLFCAAEAAVEAQDSPRGGVGLVAVGGYGRRLVGPASDVDVVFLCEDPADPRAVNLAEAVLYPLWDSGVDIGHAVRGIDESLELSSSDIRTATTLLDMRHVAGDASLLAQLSERGREEIFEPQLERFLSSLEADTAARHERFGGSLYLREPELKLGRGGLRDLDVVLWSVGARWGRDLSDAALVAQGIMTSHELAEMQAACEHLWTIRNRLHIASGRRHDRMTFDDQEELAEQLGYRDGLRLAVEQFMQTHYRNARVIARLVDCMPERARRVPAPAAQPQDLSGGFVVHNRHLQLDEDQLKGDPGLALRFYRQALRAELPPDPAARDAIAACAANPAWGRTLRRDPEAAALFLRLLVHAERAPLRRGSLLEEFHELGLLVALIPELEQVVGRVAHDAYHVYTVDAHSVAAVDRLRALSRGDLASEFFVVSRCAAEMPRPVALHLALLLHGLGAGHPDDPARHGAAIAGPVGERLGLEPQDVGHLQWLVANQGLLYHAAMRRDITDPDTIDDVVRQVETVHRTRDLYLLTFAQTSTANPSAMTAWNARMLQDLWSAVVERIEGRGGRSRHLTRVTEAVVAGGTSDDERAMLEQFVDSVPERYLLANTPEGIRQHARILQAHAADEVVVEAVDSGVGEGTQELIVATDDRPGLLADLTGVLTTSRYAIDSAQLYTRAREGRCDQAFDLFHIAHANVTTPGAAEAELKNLRERIKDVLAGKLEVEDMIRRRSRPPTWTRNGPRIATEVHVDNAASKRYTVVDIYTRDRDELLYTIARTLHEFGLTIALAKVNTEGRRVADVFYVETSSGGKLSGAGQLSRLSTVLQDTIEALDD